jgi:hypothetical protein
MNQKSSLPGPYWKILIWSLIAASLIALTLLPVNQVLLPWDDGFALARTGPPPKNNDDEGGDGPQAPELGLPAPFPGKGGPVAYPPDLPLVCK